VREAKTLRAFDNAFTAPLHGFADAADYYARSSALRFLAGIRRPTLLLSAADDPFLPAFVLDEVADAVRGNASILTEFHPRGGHVGFTAGPWPWRAFYYGEWRAAEFLRTLFATGSERPT
jgi:predicted alpha/beta-fold hydrolase